MISCIHKQTFIAEQSFKRELNMQQDVIKIGEMIKSVPDYPQPGVIFRDITPLLKNHAISALAVEKMVQPFLDTAIDYVVGIDSRGFIFASLIAHTLQKGLVLARKPGKLPRAVYSVQYALEYGTNTLEMHQDAIPKGAKVLIVDDVLATGGTAAATAQLIEKTEGETIGFSFLFEIKDLNGKALLLPKKTHTLLSY